jgi:hypothetical protein
MPATVKRRLGLDDEPSWIVTNETNIFRWPGPDLEAVVGEDSRSFVYGLLPARLYTEIRSRVLTHQRAGGLKVTRRTE